MIHIYGDLYLKPDVIGYMLIRKDPEKEGLTDKRGYPLGEKVLGYYYTIRQTIEGAILEIERQSAGKCPTGELSELVGKLSTLEENMASRLYTAVKQEVSE